MARQKLPLNRKRLATCITLSPEVLAAIRAPTWVGDGATVSTRIEALINQQISKEKEHE